MTRHTISTILLATLTLVNPAQATDQVHQVLNQLRQQAATWLQDQAVQHHADTHADVEMGPVDPRLRFPACQQFVFALPRGGHFWGRGSVEARCSEPQAWRIFLTYEIRLSGLALVSTQPLAAREPLSTAKATLEHIEYSQSPEAYLREIPAEALAARALPAGQPLSLDLLVLPKLVQAGREVRVVFEGRGFNLSQRGIALNSASLGQSVKVKTSAGRILQGWVKGPGQIEIRP